jgi:integrase
MKLTKLTDQSIRDLPLEEHKDKAEVVYFDDEVKRFGLRIRSTKRTWIIQYRRDGVSKKLTIGDAAVIPVAKALDAAKKRLAEVTLGGDPQDAKQSAREKAAITIKAKLEAYLDYKKTHKGKRRRPVRARTYEEIKRYLSEHWKPLHSMPLHKISRLDIASTISDIKKSERRGGRQRGGEIAAARAHSALSGFLGWAMGEGFLETNPIIGTNKPTKSEDRDRHLSDSELAEVWRACREDHYGRIVRLLILTGQRRDEVGGMVDSELDLDQATWLLPGDRTKNGRPHLVPLSDQALAIIKHTPRLEGHNHLFGPFSGWSKAKAALDKRILKTRQDAPKLSREPAKDVKPWTVHDLRRTVSTGMHELRVEPHIVEAVLNHVSGHKGGVAGVYNHALYAEPKRAALTLWADHVRSITEGHERKVVPMRKA